ncbi:F-box/kelch-repeat protein At3g06240-like [Henckelia pumila]|uniref:F-box/kelch-repeat protein At3g06240-like n=1 Tax=Henckelia pumila TaxID=405737 RepID=UPI003C6E68EA
MEKKIKLQLQTHNSSGARISVVRNNGRSALPTAMLIEVLIRLPVKYILKFRCVAKAWRDLIGSPLFIQRHLKHDRKQKVLLVKRKIGERHGPKSPRYGEGTERNTITYTSIGIHGPCNGLVCISAGEIVFLCNPSLREFKLIPPLEWPDFTNDLFPYQCGFGFDPVSGIYKVVNLANLYNVMVEDILVYYLYDSASNSWKQVKAKVPELCNPLDFELTFKGTMYSYIIKSPDNDPFIFCFDICTEAFRQIDFYDDFSPSEGGIRLMELNDSLAFVRYKKYKNEAQEMEIWAMEEYGIKESWTKQFVFGPYPVICPLLFLKNDLLLVESDNGQLVVCEIYGNQFDRLQFHGLRHSLSAVVIEESLISLDKIIASHR